MKTFQYQDYISKTFIQQQESYLIWNLKYSPHIHSLELLYAKCVTLCKNVKTTAAPGLSSSKTNLTQGWKES